MNPLVELLVEIVAALVRLAVWLLSHVFAGAWLAAHERGAARIAWGVVALSALHLLAGLGLALSGSPWVLAWPWSWPAIAASGVLLLVGLAIPPALDVIEKGGGRVERSEIPVALGLLLAAGVAVGVSAMWTSQTERRSLREAACAALSDRTPDALKAQGERVLAFGERVLGRDLRGRLPCPPAAD